MPRGASAAGSVRYQSILGARLNPEGLASINRAGYVWPLFHSASPLLKPANIEADTLMSVTPAFAKGGVGLSIMPVAPVQVSLSYELLSVFGNFGNVQSTASPDAPASDADRKARALAGGNYGTTGSLITVSVLLQGKLGPIVVRAQGQAFRSSMRLHAGERFWYDALTDMWVPNDGWYGTHDADLLWASDFGLVAGLRHTLAHGFYRAPRSDGGIGNRNSHHRLGPLVAYTFRREEGDGWFEKPTVVLLCQWFLQHRYRAHSPVPQVVLAFLWQGQLWP